MSKKKLFEDDSEEDIAIKTENEYAKKYDTWRKKEEIYKCKFYLSFFKVRNNCLEQKETSLTDTKVALKANKHHTTIL